MLFNKQVLESYFTPMPTLGYSIFSKNDQIAALSCSVYVYKVHAYAQQTCIFEEI